MYGHAKKKPYQLEADKAFLERVDKEFSNRKEASEHYSELAWGYYEKGDLATAMRRFNQAWLLDSLNCQPYWGFGNIYGIQGKVEESIDFLKKAMELNCTNPGILEAFTSNWLELYVRRKDNQYLDNAEKSISESLKSDPTNARILYQKAEYFYHRENFDSAYVYADKAIKIDSSSVSSEFMQILKTKKK